MVDNLSLETDLYQLTMAQGYWDAGKTTAQASFYAFFRENPFKGGYTVACGNDQLERLIREFSFDDDDISYLASLDATAGGKLFKPEFLEWLGNLRLHVDVDVIPDGTIVFPYEPLIRVTGPLPECQLLETALLNGMNFQTLIATKASRVCYAARGKTVSEFGLRRSQGPDGGLSASRASYVGGVDSVANVLAGKKFGIPVSGTHAHSWIMSFSSEIEAFRAYAKSMPGNCILLVDTYNVKSGMEAAIQVGLEMRERGEKLLGVRLDSGDLAWLSKMARDMLDKAGLTDTKIIASNDLDEYTINALHNQKACIDSYGVGTRLVTAYEQAALGGVYKISATRDSTQDPWKPCLKLSEEAVKQTIPGILNVYRFYNDDGGFAGDCIFDENRKLEKNLIAVDPLDHTRRKEYLEGMKRELLLKPFARSGKIDPELDTRAHTARKRFKNQWVLLDNSIKRFTYPHRYPAGIERELINARTQMILSLRGLDSLY